MNADTLLICGTDPYETKTILFTQWIMKGIQNGQKGIFMVPRRTAGVAYAEKNGGLWIDVLPGTDLLVVNAIARIIVENGWEDSRVDPEMGQQQVGLVLRLRSGHAEHAVAMAHDLGQVPDQRVRGLEEWLMLARTSSSWRTPPRSQASTPRRSACRRNGWPSRMTTASRPKTSIMIEKGFYWSNNTGNTQAISALGIICGAGGGRPGQVIGRAGGHQRGGVRGGKYPRNKSPMKLPGRRRRALDTDTYTDGGPYPHGPCDRHDLDPVDVRQPATGGARSTN